MRFLYFILVIFGLLTILSCRQEKRTLFHLMPSSYTGIKFMNEVKEDETYNVLNYMNIYTGAGVAAGDVNNDGLIDLFFSGNQSSCQLYLNKGNMHFEDVTVKAGLKTDRWCTGVSMVDLNQDGFLDVYINVAGSIKFGNTANLLFINNKNGTFTEQAAAFGIADRRLTMNASFFDYDKDGDLDLFLITDPADGRVDDINTALGKMKNGESPGTDILYRNNGNGTFTDVSRQAGILMEGYSLATAVSDVNNDGWPDLYVSNDFLTDDILYINNRDGTFTDRLHECLKHTSYSSMGNDIADFNNDGLPDIFTLDMLPEDNYRKKMIVPAASYDKFQLLLQKGYEPQYTRNALQLNNGNGSFSDIAFLSGVSATDWSWSSLFADYDNDGDKDLMVTNGFYRDFGDQDFIVYQAQLNYAIGRIDAQREEKLRAVKGLAKIPLQNYVFENNGDLSFTRRNEEWGLTDPGFSNGACYADLDNDGDLDLVINQFNSEAKVFRNNANEYLGNNYITIKLTGTSPNLQAIGSKVYVYANAKMQMQELNPYRGYESTVELALHFGVAKANRIDSIKIIWPDGKVNIEYNLPVNKVVNISINANSSAIDDLASSSTMTQGRINRMFVEDAELKGLNYVHHESYFVDFNIQPLLPHMHSRLGPGIAVGDINGDGLEDCYVGAGAKNNGSFFVQHANGKFMRRELIKDIAYEDQGVLLFDADGDHDLDLYVVSGSSENEERSLTQQDRLYINNGKGNFVIAENILPDTRASGSCVVGCDYDKDGDVDLFVGGRVLPGQYPLTPQSYLLQNDGGKFTDHALNELPSKGKIGMVTSALWTDFDNDGWIDLLLCGEFMPIVFVKNNHGRLMSDEPLLVDHSSGWWNSICAGDFDEDGDTDYILGNLGLNTRLKASPSEPLCIYAKDFNADGRIDPVLCYYVQGKNHIYPTRDELIRQMSAIRLRFQTYKEYASVSFDETFTKDELSDAYVVKSECFETSYLENKGGGKFQRKQLPIECQFAPVYGMLVGDFNEDGHPDILMAGNSYSTEVSTGNYDAMQGLLLAGNGKGDFRPLLSRQTGFNADADSKGMAQINLGGHATEILVANNNDKLKSYSVVQQKGIIARVSQDDVHMLVYKADGTSFKQELFLGSGYLSASSRTICFSEPIERVEIENTKGMKRIIKATSR